MGTRFHLASVANRATWAVLASSAALCFAAPAAAQASASSNARTEAIVLRPLSFFKVDDLHFGEVIPSITTAGTVRLQPNGARTSTGGIVLVNNLHQVARFTGLGTNNQQVAISVQANSIFITGPGAPMRVRNFEIGSTPTTFLSTAPLRFRINSATGAFSFPLGATLEVAANQAAGEYTGNFTIILNYQ